MSCYRQPRPMAGRVKGTVLPADRRVSKDVRSDHRDHYQKPFATQRRCGVCHKNTRKGCHKCGIGLCNKVLMVVMYAVGYLVMTVILV
jgi:hypothetical protein